MQRVPRLLWWVLYAFPLITLILIPSFVTLIPDESTPLDGALLAPKLVQLYHDGGLFIVFTTLIVGLLWFWTGFATYLNWLPKFLKWLRGCVLLFIAFVICLLYYFINSRSFEFISLLCMLPFGILAVSEMFLTDGSRSPVSPLKLLPPLMGMGLSIFTAGVILRGNQYEMDSFEAVKATYRIVVATTIHSARIQDGFPLTTSTEKMALVECPHGSTMCRLKHLTGFERGYRDHFSAHLENDEVYGSLSMIVNVRTVFVLPNVYPLENVPPAITATTPITPANASQVTELAYIVHARAGHAYWFADSKSILITSYGSDHPWRTFRHALSDLKTPRLVGFRESVPLGYGVFAYKSKRSIYATNYPTNRDTTIYVWELATGDRIARLTGADRVSATALSSEGQFLAYTVNDGTVIVIYDLKARQEAKRLYVNLTPKPEWGRYISLLTFSPDGKTLVGADNTGIRLFDLATSTERRLENAGYDHISNTIAFSPDSTILARVAESIELWDVQTGKMLRAIDQLGYSTSSPVVAFSSDGRVIASARGNGVIVLFDVQNGSRLAELRGHNESIADISFSPDGTLILSVGWEQVRLWGIK